MKSSLLRQARLCRVVRAAHLPRLRSSPSAFARPSLAPTTSLSLSQLRSPALNVRFNSHAAAEEPRDSHEQSSSPTSITEFEQLRALGVADVVVDAITQGMGYKTMSEVQSMTIHKALGSKDIVAQAKTGTGKTLAFLIPIIQKLVKERSMSRLRSRSDDIRAIIISPTRELAMQIAEEASRVTRRTGIVVQTAVGGTQKSSMLRQAQRQGCDILVATPGRLCDILSDPHSRIAAPKLQALVLDEADRMLEVGFDRELQEILRLLPDPSQLPRQTMLFSATLPSNVIGLARSYVDQDNFEFVQTIKADDLLTHDKVPQFVVPVKGLENTFPALLELINRESTKPGGMPFKAIVFLPTTAMVEVATSLFQGLKRTNRNIPYVESIHSKLTQSRRTAAADNFRRLQTGILISSDVTARGMDFPNVSHVIQVGAPPNREQYIHRLGRTGRADKDGQGWLLLHDGEMQGARKMLGGLPISRHSELESATYDFARPPQGVPPPTVVTEVTEAYQRVPEEALVSSYMTMLNASKSTDSRVLATVLENWTRYSWGWENPPKIPYRLARMKGIANVPGFNIDRGHERPERGDFSDRRGSDRGFPSRSSGRGDRFADKFARRGDDMRSPRPGRFGGARRDGGQRDSSF